MRLLTRYHAVVLALLEKTQYTRVHVASNFSDRPLTSGVRIASSQARHGASGRHVGLLNRTFRFHQVPHAD
jgi:hypothetical protein